MSEQMHQCERCEQSFYYDPKNHKCPEQWESETADLAPLASPYEGMSWVEESMTKVGAK